MEYAQIANANIYVFRLKITAVIINALIVKKL